MVVLKWGSRKFGIAPGAAEAEFTSRSLTLASVPATSSRGLSKPLAEAVFMRTVDFLMTPTVTTLGEIQPPATPAQPNNAGVAGGQIHSQLWPSAGAAATTAHLNALNSNSYAVSTP